MLAMEAASPAERTLEWIETGSLSFRIGDWRSLVSASSVVQYETL